MTGICDVCGKHSTSIEFTSSGIAPVSYGLCMKCREFGAENIGVVGIWIATHGGCEATASFGGALKSYFDGEYKDWSQICDFFERNEEQILRSFESEWELVDDVGEEGSI